MDIDWDEMFQGPATQHGGGDVRDSASCWRYPSEGAQEVLRSGGMSSVCPLRVVTWNLLAPCWHRTPGGCEAADEAAWRTRLHVQFALLEELQADIILLQEWWWASQAYVQLWHEWTLRQGMEIFVTPRTRGKPDGCATVVRSDLCSDKLEFTSLSFNDLGDRVMQLLEFDIGGLKWLVVNTHMTFPHPNQHDPVMRRHQGRKLGEAVAERMQGRHVVVGGDFNGTSDDEAVRLAVEGPRLTLHSANEATHCDHHGNMINCDFILTAALDALEVRLHGPAGCLTPGGGFCSDHRPFLVKLCLPCFSEIGATCN